MMRMMRKKECDVGKKFYVGKRFYVGTAASAVRRAKLDRFLLMA
jgi:hypothetical protein